MLIYYVWHACTCYLPTSAVGNWEAGGTISYIHFVWNRSKTISSKRPCIKTSPPRFHTFLGLCKVGSNKIDTTVSMSITPEVFWWSMILKVETELLHYLINNQRMFNVETDHQTIHSTQKLYFNEFVANVLRDNIHCDTLMMQQKEACRKHICVLPACFLKKLAK